MEQVEAVTGESPSSTSGPVPPQRAIPGQAVRTWTAPTTPTAPLSATPAAARSAVVLDPVVVLNALADRIDGVTGAILASVDGFGLARSASMGDEPAHAAMLAAAVGLAHQLTSMGGGDRLRQLVVDHDAGLMFVWPVGPQRVLAVLATSRVDQRALRTAVQAHVSTLSGEPA
jgi:uncharacterized protein